ncbi:MAG: cytochrome c class [Geminicoccaceae bacterium]|nr:cytochrome c class [Geminicoccaceae bacterium]
MRRLALISVVVAVGLAACDRGPLADRARRRQSLGNLPADVRPAPEPPARFEVGRPATPAEIAVWDVDVSPDGAGLPAGRGTPAEGAAVYAAKCASCHGMAGEGTPAGPKLVGREPADSISIGRDPTLVKTDGNYWPYASTLFDYVRRSMPITAPGSLTNDEVYAVVAYLLAENGIIDRSAPMDSLTLAAVKMPARDRFVVDDRRGGQGFK